MTGRLTRHAIFIKTMQLLAQHPSGEPMRTGDEVPPDGVDAGDSTGPMVSLGEEVGDPTRTRRSVGAAVEVSIPSDGVSAGEEVSSSL